MTGVPLHLPDDRRQAATWLPLTLERANDSFVQSRRVTADPLLTHPPEKRPSESWRSSSA